MSTDPESGQATQNPLRSTFAGDEEMAELIIFFVEAMGERVDALRAANEAGDVEKLHRLAHQLKGAASGYGFEPITDSAAAVDALLKEDPTGQQQAEAITQAARDLIALCSRVSA